MLCKSECACPHKTISRYAVFFFFNNEIPTGEQSCKCTELSLKRQEWNWTARAQTGGDGNNHKELLQSSKHFPAGSKRKHAFIIVGAIVNIYSPFISVYYTQKNNKYNSTNDKIGSQQYRYVRYIKYSQILTFARNKNNGIEI